MQGVFATTPTVLLQWWTRVKHINQFDSCGVLSLLPALQLVGHKSFKIIKVNET